jgi:hypothetical protein
MDNAMRDKIAEILENMPEDMNGWEDAADEIIAALPSMVKPLVWHRIGEGHYRHMVNSKMSWRCQVLGGEWYITYSVPGYCDTLIEGKWPTLSEAKAAANAHHVDAGMAIFGVNNNG